MLIPSQAPLHPILVINRPYKHWSSIPLCISQEPAGKGESETALQHVEPQVGELGGEVARVVQREGDVCEGIVGHDAAGGFDEGCLVRDKSAFAIDRGG